MMYESTGPSSGDEIGDSLRKWNQATANFYSDQLAGITFALRLQTHNGDNVPLGLYQDTACTIPATEEFDIVAGWKDELGTSGLSGTQSVEAKCPLLVFDGGIPTLLFDGVDDALVFTDAFQSLTDCLGVIGFKPDLSPSGPTGAGVTLWEFGTMGDSAYWAYDGNTIYDGFGTTGRRSAASPVDLDQQYNTAIVRLESNESAYWINTQSLLTNAAVTIAWSTAPRIGENTAFGGIYFAGAINTVLITASDVSDATRLLVQDYAQNLQP